MEMRVKSRFQSLHSKLPSHFTVGKKIKKFKKGKNGPYMRLWGLSKILESQKCPPKLSCCPRCAGKVDVGENVGQPGALWGSAREPGTHHPSSSLKCSFPFAKGAVSYNGSETPKQSSKQMHFTHCKGLTDIILSRKNDF